MSSVNRVNSNIVDRSLIDQSSKLRKKMLGSQMEISSNQKIQRVSDNPSIGSRYLKISIEVADLVESSRILDKAKVLLTAGFDQLQSVSRLNERAQSELSSIGPHSSSEDMAAISEVLNHMIEEAVQYLNARHLGTNLFSGDYEGGEAFSVSRDPQGKVTSLSYNGSGDGPDFRVSESLRIRAFSEGSVNQSLKSFVDLLVQARDACSGTDKAQVQSLNQQMISNHDSIVNGVAGLGGRIEQVSSLREVQESIFHRSAESANTLIDLDLPSAIQRFHDYSRAYEAALRISAQMSRMSLLNFMR